MHLTVSREDFFPMGRPAAERYLTALLAEGVRLGYLTEEDAAVKQAESMVLLSERIALYGGGQSDSVKEETAVRILTSVLYHIGIALYGAESPMDKLCSTSLTKLHDEGLYAAIKLKEKAEVLVLLLRRRSAPTWSGGLQRFALRDAPRFIREYDPLYDGGASLWADIPEVSHKGTVVGLRPVVALILEVLKR